MKKNIKKLLLLSTVLAVLLVPLQGALAADTSGSRNTGNTCTVSLWKGFCNRITYTIFNGWKWIPVRHNPADCKKPTPGSTTEPTPAPTAKPTQNPGQSSGYQLSAEEQKMIQLVNQERQKAGVSPLTIDPELSRVARIKSQDMKDNGYFSHTSPTYGSPFDMMKSFGITYRAAGENIALNSSVEGAHTSLMNSEGHRENIMNSIPTVFVSVPGNIEVHCPKFIQPCPLLENPNMLTVRGRGLIKQKAGQCSVSFSLTAWDFGYTIKFRMKIDSSDPGFHHDSGIVAVSAGDLAIVNYFH